MGRAFLPEEDQAPGARPVAMLSSSLLEDRLLGDPGVIGGTVFVNSRPFTVVGVAPEGFTSLCTAAAPDVWVPVAIIGNRSCPTRSTARGTLRSVAQRGWPAQARREFGAGAGRVGGLGSNLAKEFPGVGEPVRSFSHGGRAQPAVHPGQHRRCEAASSVVSAVAGIVVADCVLQRCQPATGAAATRQREIALRLSLRRLARSGDSANWLTESLLLGLLGAGAVAFSWPGWAWTCSSRCGPRR